jgi:hypothetical protein
MFPVSLVYTIVMLRLPESCVHDDREWANYLFLGEFFYRPLCVQSNSGR